MRVEISDDLDLEKIAESGQCFRCQRTSRGAYRFITGDHVLYLEKQGETVYEAECPEEDWESVWKPYLDLSRDYRAIRHSLPPERFMDQAVACGKGIRILRQDRWELLISFIISQRKSIPAIKKTIEALCCLCGTPIQTEYETICAFPTAQALCQVTEAQLAACGLGYRLPYVLDAADKVRTGAISLEQGEMLGDDELRTLLKTVKGVGDKVANCIMLFGYGRLGCVPVDTWIHKIMENEYGGKNPFLQYGEYAGILQQYAFYYILQDSKKGRK